MTDTELETLAGVGASISMAPQCAGPGMVPMAMVVCYNDRFFQTPNTFLTQTLSIGKATNIFTWSPSVAISSQTLCTTQQDALV